MREHHLCVLRERERAWLGSNGGHLEHGPGLTAETGGKRRFIGAEACRHSLLDWHMCSLASSEKLSRITNSIKHFTYFSGLLVFFFLA